MMALGATTVVNDPLISLTDGQPKGQTEEKEHDRLVSRIETALSNDTQQDVTDQWQGELRLVLDRGSVWVHQNGSGPAIELYQLGLPLLKRLCKALGV